ncbi:unnamed protein product, partial [marine sediment metagenome]
MAWSVSFFVTLTTLPGAENGEKPGGGEAARLFGAGPAEASFETS